MAFRQTFLITMAFIGLYCASAYADDTTLTEFRSINGVMMATLEAKETKTTLDKDTVIDTQIYNDNYAGPVFRVHPGDTMKIKLINHMTEPTNLHFHGIQTSPLGKSDNIHNVANPGESFDYIVTVPTTQPPGLYWYHDHIHGMTDKHVMRGLSGAIVVEGFAEQFPELANIKEQIFVLKDYEYDNDFNHTDNPHIIKDLQSRIKTINGQLFTSLTMRPGETQLWRVANLSADLYFHLTLAGHKFRIIGDDGIAARKETVVDTIDIKPASRLSILVDAGDAGVYDLTALHVPTGDSNDEKSDRLMGKVTVSGDPMTPIATITHFPDRQDLRSLNVDKRRGFIFSQLNDDKNFFIDGKKYDHDRMDTRVPLGNVEEWTIKNNTDDFHEFHIHQVSFQVTDINGVQQDFNGYVDNVRIPEHGYVKILLPFTDPLILGQFVYHCHVLKHEDGGMMANMEVYDPKVSPLVRFWNDISSCCSKKSINGQCLWSNIKRYSATH